MNDITGKNQYGLSWLKDPQQTLCPKNCHYGITTDDVVAYAKNLRATHDDPRPLIRAWLMHETVPTPTISKVPADVVQNFSVKHAEWAALRDKVDTMLAEKGSALRPVGVHMLGDALLGFSNFKGRVQRRQAISELDLREMTLDVSTRRILGDVIAGMKRQEIEVAQWAADQVASALGGELTASELGIAGDLLKSEGAISAAQVLYTQAQGRAATPSEKLYFHAQVLECRIEESATGPDEAMTREIAQVYHEANAAIAVSEMPSVAAVPIDGVTRVMTIGLADQLYITEAISGRLYYSTLMQDPAVDMKILDGLESQLHARLTTRADRASLPEAIHATAFAQVVAQRYTMLGGVLSAQHAARDDAISKTMAQVQDLVQVTEKFGPKDSISATVLAETRVPLVWMGNVDAFRRVSRPWDALHTIQNLEARYAKTESFKTVMMSLYREAPQHFTANMKFVPNNVAMDWDGVEVGLREASQSLNTSASPWRRFFVDLGTTLTGAGGGFLVAGPPGAIVGAVAGGVGGEVGNVGINSIEDRHYIAQSARAGMTDVTSTTARASLGMWAGVLVLTSASRALGGYGIGNVLARRFGTTEALRDALSAAASNPVATLQAARSGLPGAIFGTSEVGRSFYRNYWFHLGFMAVGVDTVALHRQESGHLELRSDWVPDTWLGYAGIGLMLLSPQSFAVFNSAGRSYLARWWTTEMARYPMVLGRATIAAARGLGRSTPQLIPTWTLTQWREGLRNVLQEMPQLSGRHMSQWSLGEWWDVGTRLRALNTGGTVDAIVAKEAADFQVFAARLAPWDKVMGESYWWDGWRHARLSNMNFPGDVNSLYKLAFLDKSVAAQAAGSTAPIAIRRGMDLAFGAINTVADRVFRWNVRQLKWEPGGFWNTFEWATVPSEKVGWDSSMGLLQSLRYGKVHAYLNGRIDAAAHAVRTTVPEFSNILHTPMIAKETDVSAHMVARKGFADLMEQVFGAWSTTRSEKYPTLALLIECSKSLMSAEFIRAHRLGGLVTVWDKVSDGKLDTWAGFYSEMAMWNYVTQLLGFSTTAASDIGTGIYVFTQAQLRKYSGENLLDQDPNMLRPAFYQFHAGFFYMRLVSGVHAPGLRFMDGLPFVRNTFPSISSVPPALRVGVEMDKVNFRTPLGYVWSVLVPPASMGIALGDFFKDEKFADASGYYGTRALLKFIFSAVILNPRQVRKGYITALATLEARFWGYLADLGLNKFTDSFIGKQLFNKVVTDMLKSDDPEILDAVWDKFCETNTTLSVGGLLSNREKEEGAFDHPLQFGYRWEPTGLNAWVEWDDDRKKPDPNGPKKKDRRGYFEILADDRPEALQRLVEAYRRQMVSKKATWRSPGQIFDSRAPFYINRPTGSGFDLQTRDAKGMMVFAMVAKYYAWKASQGHKGWEPFVQLVNDPRHHSFWNVVPEFHRRSDIHHQIELMTDQKWKWKPILDKLSTAHPF